MDLLALLSTLWRHRIAAFLVVVLTAAAAGGVLYVKPPPWSGTTSYLLVEPPAAPTEAQVEDDPSLKAIQSDNPYTRYGTTSVIIDVVGRRVDTKAVQRAVVADGGSPVFEVVPSIRYGTASPIIDITSTAGSKPAVLASLRTLGTQVAAQLASIQAEDQVDPKYTYTLRQIDDPEQLTRKVSNTLRLLVGVAAMGLLALLVVMGALEGRDRRRRARTDRPLRGRAARRAARAATYADPGAEVQAPAVVTTAEIEPDPRDQGDVDTGDVDTVIEAAVRRAREPRPHRGGRPVTGASSRLSRLPRADRPPAPEPSAGLSLLEAPAAAPGEPTEPAYDFGFVEEFDAVTALDLGPEFWLEHDGLDDGPVLTRVRAPQLHSSRAPLAAAVLRGPRADADS